MQNGKDNANGCRICKYHGDLRTRKAYIESGIFCSINKTQL